MNGNAHGVVSAEPKPSLWSLANADVLYKPFGDQKFNYYPAGFGLRKGDHDFLVFLKCLPRPSPGRWSSRTRRCSRASR